MRRAFLNFRPSFSLSYAQGKHWLDSHRPARLASMVLNLGYIADPRYTNLRLIRRIEA